MALSAEQARQTENVFPICLKVEKKWFFKWKFDFPYIIVYNIMKIYSDSLHML